MARCCRTSVARYPHIRRLVMVADRGLLSVDNLADLSAISLPGGQPLEFILAVPGRRYGEFAELLQPLHTAAAPEGETVAETSWEGLRLIVAHNPQRAQERHHGAAPPRHDQKRHHDHVRSALPVVTLPEEPQGRSIAELNRRLTEA